MTPPHPKKLLVEGADDQRVIPYLIEAACDLRWGERNEPKLVDVEPIGGIENLLKPGLIEAEMNASGRLALGLLVDADERPLERWKQVRGCCIRFCPDFPEVPPKEGLVLMSERSVRLGVWMMPDNQDRGMLETFLAVMRPVESDSLWQHANAACIQAASLRARFKDAHRDKALLHTWLSWQDPPGRQLHEAIKFKVLSRETPHSICFVTWFRRLFEV
jgi:hypothetical protein